MPTPKTSAKKANAKSTNGSLHRWLISVLISVLAAGGGIVALLNYFQQRGSTASITVTASMTSPVSDPKLKDFIEKYVQAGNFATPDVELEFLADPMIDYFGASGLTLADIRADREHHIKAWPTRKYSLEGPPQLLGKEGSDVFVVLAVVRYELINDKVTPPKRRNGISRSIYRVKAVGTDFKINSVMEAKQE
jgi:hypothetical protein